MATSDIEICNIALQMLGADKIVSFTEGTKRASLCDAIYPTARDESLQAYPWNFTLVRVVLAKLATAPAFGWSFQYQLPTDPYCLRPLSVNEETDEWSVEGRKILTDAGTTIDLLYISRVTSVTEYSPLYVMALATHMAELMAINLTESPAVEKSMKDRYQKILLDAYTTDGQEGSTQRADIDILCDVRSHRFSDWKRNKNPFS